MGSTTIYAESTFTAKSRPTARRHLARQLRVIAYVAGKFDIPTTVGAAAESELVGVRLHAATGGFLDETNDDPKSFI